MGAWGYSVFENDDAGDWVWDLEESTDMSAIVEALDLVTDEAGEYLEAPDCSMAVAAAEVVAALHGKPAANLPEEVSKWVAGKPAPNAAISAQAVRAIEAVLDRSELKELWEENEEEYPNWVASLNDIKARIASTK